MRKWMQDIEHIDTPWALGVHDRGHGHESYAVIAVVQDEFAVEGWVPRPVLVETATPELASYIAELHNERLKDAPSASLADGLVGKHPEPEDHAITGKEEVEEIAAGIGAILSNAGFRLAAIFRPSKTEN